MMDNKGYVLFNIKYIKIPKIHSLISEFYHQLK